MFLKLMKFEMKRLLNSLPLKFAVALNLVILIVFIAGNATPLQRSKEDAVSFFHSMHHLGYTMAYFYRGEIIRPFVEAIRAMDESEFLELSPIERAVFELNEVRLEYIGARLYSSGRVLDYLLAGDYDAAFYEYHNFMRARHEYAEFSGSDRITGVLGPITRGMRPANYRVLAEFSGYLIENNIGHINQYDMTPFNFLKQVFSRLLPFYILFVIAFVCFRNIAGDIEVKTLAFNITQPVGRIKLFLSKYTAVVLVSLLALFGPLFAVALSLGFINGFDSPRYPVLVHNQAYSSLVPLPNNLMIFERIMGRRLPDYFSAFSAPGIDGVYLHRIGIDRVGISRFNVLSEYLSFDFAPGEGLTFVPIYIYLLLTLPLWIAGTVLFTSFVFLLGLVFEKRIFSFVLSLGIASISLLSTAPMSNLSLIERLNPFMILHVGTIISGLGSTTGLSGLLVSLMPAAVMFCVCCVLFKRLEMR